MAGEDPWLFEQFGTTTATRGRLGVVHLVELGRHRSAERVRREVLEHGEPCIVIEQADEAQPGPRSPIETLRNLSELTRNDAPAQAPRIASANTRSGGRCGAGFGELVLGALLGVPDDLVRFQIDLLRAGEFCWATVR